MPKPVESVARRVRRFKIDQYLQCQRCTLWPGISFDLTDDKERAQAVAFLESILDGLG